MRSLAGTGPLIRLALRRDRVILPAWIAVFVLTVTYSAIATRDLYPTPASRIQVAATMNDTTTLVAFYGRLYGSSLGALSLLKMSGIGAAGIAILAFMLVIRHTRAEEEAGRLELLGAGAVGRDAALSAALAVGIGASVTIGALCALGLVATGLPVAGSVAFGLAWATTGCAFSAIGALSAQLTPGGRAATGIAAAFLGLVYILRAVGDASGHDQATWVSWLSPIGWSQQVRPFAHERWQVLTPLVVFAFAVGAGAYALARRRDLGGGLLADRPGPAIAGTSLSSPLGLARRLQRGTLLAWAVGVALMTPIIGSIASNVAMIADNPAARDFIAKLGGTHALTEAFLALELGMLGSLLSVYGMQAAMRLRSEEVSWRADLVLSTATGRERWLASHVALAIAGVTGLLLLGGLLAGAGYAVQAGDATEIGPALLGAAVQIPAVCVMIALVVAVFGVAPRATNATWGALVAFLLLGEFGSLFNLPRWVMDLSPFAHVPRIPGGHVDLIPLLGLLVTAVALIGVGVTAFGRRDVGSA